jgi:RNA 3'-terminal phosphate cyclase (ATP)
MLRVDGAQRSGSGTIVRTSVALAALLGEPLEMFNVRAKRQPPGLRPQHLRAVQAAAQVAEGRVEGAQVGARELRFWPSGALRGGRYQWDIGTAGSTTMLALTLLPLAAFADGPTTFRIQGGLFQDMAPSAFHTQHALLPLLARMGIQAELEVVRPGYVPRGGGIIEMRVQPVRGRLRPLRLPEQRPPWRLWGLALSSHLQDRRVSERMAQECQKALARRGMEATFRILYDASAPQPGAALALFAHDQGGCILGADMAGAPGRPSEAIGRRVAETMLEDMESGATVDRHLADQLIIFAALAEGESEWVVPQVTDHVETNLWLVETLLGAKARLRGRHLCIEGIGYERA